MTEKPNLDWNVTNKGYLSSGCSSCHETKILFISKNGNPTLTYEPSTPGKCVCCLFCFTPLVVFSCCILPLPACGKNAYFVQFRRDETRGGVVVCDFRTKSACSEEVQLISDVKSVSITVVDVPARQGHQSYQYNKLTVFYGQGQEQELPSFDMDRQVNTFVASANELCGSVSALQRTQAPTPSTGLVPMQMDRAQAHAGGRSVMPVPVPQPVTVQVPPGAGPGVMLLVPTPSGGSVRR